jgi:hypothetical protein
MGNRVIKKDRQLSCEISFSVMGQTLFVSKSIKYHTVSSLQDPNLWDALQLKIMNPFGLAVSIRTKEV